MGKDSNKNRYLSVAVPKMSRLLQRIEEVRRETNLPDSQILAYFAAEYVRLTDSFGITQLAPTGSLATPDLGSSCIPISVAASGEGTEDDDLDAFGPPDE